MWGGHVSIKLYCQKWVTVIFGPWVIVCQPVLYTTARNKMKNMEYPKKKKKREREREREKWGEFNKLAQSPRISLWQSCVLNPCFLLPDLMFFPLHQPPSLTTMAETETNLGLMYLPFVPSDCKHWSLFSVHSRYLSSSETCTSTDAWLSCIVSFLKRWI